MGGSIFGTIYALIRHIQINDPTVIIEASKKNITSDGRCGLCGHHYRRGWKECKICAKAQRIVNLPDLHQVVQAEEIPTEEQSLVRAINYYQKTGPSWLEDQKPRLEDKSKPKVERHQAYGIFPQFVEETKYEYEPTYSTSHSVIQSEIEFRNALRRNKDVVVYLDEDERRALGIN